MTLLGAIAKRGALDNAQIPLTSSLLLDWLNGGKVRAGVSVSEQRVFGLTAWYRAIALLAGTSASLPLKTFLEGSRQRTHVGVLEDPNPAQTPFEFWQTIYAFALAYGNAFALKIRDGADMVVEAWPIHPGRVTVDSVPVSERYPDGKQYTIVNPSGTASVLSSWEIAQFPYLSLDGRQGLSPLRIARESLGIGIAAEQTSGDFYGSGNMLSGILTSAKALTDVSAARLKTNWREKVAHNGDIAILDNDVTFTPVSIPPADAQLLDSRKFGVTEIARLFGIPPHMLGDVEKSTSWGTGIEQQTIAFVVYTLRPWLTLIEQRVTREFLPGGRTARRMYAEYSLEGLLRGDSAARAAFYQSGITNGWLNRNEARGYENLEPADGLDEFIVPANMTLIHPGR